MRPVWRWRSAAACFDLGVVGPNSSQTSPAQTVQCFNRQSSIWAKQLCRSKHDQLDCTVRVLAVVNTVPFDTVKGVQAVQYSY